MTRFLVFFNLIAFVAVSCAGPNKVKAGWTKPDFRQDQFENDRRECMNSIGKNLDSEDFGRALEEYLEKKDYEFKKAEEPPKESSSAKEVLVGAGVIALFVVLSPLILAYGVLLVGSAP